MYTLDTQAARKADSTGSNISEIGKYIGKFTQAEDLLTDKKTRGLALNFESTTGQKSRLSVYTVMADGKQLMGYDLVMALLTCLKLREIKAVSGTVKYWDNEARAEATRQGHIVPELCEKPIGVLLETEDYLNTSGEVKSRMILKSVFQASTELTASEILDRKTAPEQLPRQVAALRHRPLKAAKGATPQRTTAPAGASGFDDMDDDIPF